MDKKVFVSGCFDVLHSGHIEFLKRASEFGELYVSIGSDKTIKELKSIPPHFNQEERLFFVNSIKYVKRAFIGSGSGRLDFLKEIKEIKPDIFIVNEDGSCKEKLELCEKLGMEYIVLKREPKRGLPLRSSTSIKQKILMPYRIDLAGGWLDQPFVSKHYPGPVLTISINPSCDFNLKSGMATSTRNKAIALWKNGLPSSDEKTAKILFCCDNPPGKKEISGSQDSLGIVLPGLNYIYYNGEYWPKKIEKTNNKEILDWLESIIYLVPLYPRKEGYNVLEEVNINKENAKRLSEATENCYKAIFQKDIKNFGKFLRESFDAQVKMFPDMVNDKIIKLIKEYEKETFGLKISGAGGGGYLILISEKPVKEGIKIKIRRN